MDSCFASDHPMEYRESVSGEEWWYCLTCNQLIPRYHDTGAGG